MRRILHKNINTEKFWEKRYLTEPSEEGKDWLKNEIITNHIVDSSRVVELGCGAGWLLSRIASGKPHCEIVGVDFSGTALARLGHDHRVKIVKEDITEESFLLGQERSFDYVICSEVLEHLDKPGELVKNISNLLADNGIAIITTPYGDHIPAREHVWEFSVEDIEALMKDKFSQYWVYLWASGGEVSEVNSGRLVYPSGHLDVIWAIGIK